MPLQEDLALHQRLPEAQAHRLRILHVPLGQGSLQQLWSQACGAGAAPEAPLLLLPEGYALLPGAGISQVHAPAHAAQSMTSLLVSFPTLHAAVIPPTWPPAKRASVLLAHLRGHLSSIRHHRNRAESDCATDIILSPLGLGPQLLEELLWTAEQRGNMIGALAFGAKLPSGAHAFPSAPTWLLHSDFDMSSGGGARRCYEGVPALVRAATFCGAFLGEARLVQGYSAWALAALLARAGRHLHTYPLVRCSIAMLHMFILLRMSLGYSCLLGWHAACCRRSSAQCAPCSEMCLLACAGSCVRNAGMQGNQTYRQSLRVPVLAVRRRRCSGWTSGAPSWATSRAWRSACPTRGGPPLARPRARCCRTLSSRCRPRRSGTLAGEGRLLLHRHITLAEFQMHLTGRKV